MDCAEKDGRQGHAPFISPSWNCPEHHSNTQEQSSLGSKLHSPQRQSAGSQPLSTSLRASQTRGRLLSASPERSPKTAGWLGSWRRCDVGRLGHLGRALARSDFIINQVLLQRPAVSQLTCQHIRYQQTVPVGLTQSAEGPETKQVAPRKRRMQPLLQDRSITSCPSVQPAACPMDLDSPALKNPASQFLKLPVSSCVYMSV